MKRNILCLLMIPIFLLSGCGVFRYLDGSSDEEVRKFSMSRKDLEKEVATLQSDRKSLQMTLDEKQGEIARLDAKDKENLKAISDVQARIESLEKEKVALQEENKKIKSAAVAKEDTLLEKQAREKAQAAPAKELRIKVLTGTGKLSAARELSKSLKAMGYKVERVDRAPTSNFRGDTVFFAKDSEKEAKELAGRLGGKAVVKPLTWSSIFDIIVVAGKKQE